MDGVNKVQPGQMDGVHNSQITTAEECSQHDPDRADGRSHQRWYGSSNSFKEEETSRITVEPQTVGSDKKMTKRWKDFNYFVECEMD